MNRGVSGGCSCGVVTQVCVVAIKHLRKGVATHVDNLYGPLSKENRAVRRMHTVSTARCSCEVQ